MTVKITARQLVDFGRPSSDLAMVLAPALTEQCNRHGITTNRRLRHFMAQIAHECAGFRSMTESLNYSREGLMATFSRQRISAADCLKFGRDDKAKRPANQNAIANILYGGAFGAKNLGNTQPGDGWRYRGRSPIMATGRANYAMLQTQTGLPLLNNPDLAADPKIGALLAAKWWESKGLNQIADEDAGERVYATIRENTLNNELDDMEQARRRINGGTNGLKDTQDWLLKAAIQWPGK